MKEYDENFVFKGEDGKRKILLVCVRHFGLPGVIQLDGLNGDILLLSTDDEKQRILLQPSEGNIWLGGNGKDGDLMLFPSDASGAAVSDPKRATIHLDGNNASISLSTFSGYFSTYQEWIRLDAGEGKSSIRLKALDLDPTNIEHMTTPVDRILLDAEEGNIWLGGNGKDGDLMLFPSTASGADVNDPNHATIHLDGDAGEIIMHDAKGNDHTRLNGAGNLWLGGKKAGGDIVLFKKGAEDIRKTDEATIWLEGDRGKILLGGPDAGGDLLLFRKGTRGDPDTSSATIRLSGEQGDIILQNGDCAEDFDVSESTQIEPGTVMVLDQEGKLEPSTGAYDKKVAGVISGAGEHKPGIVLGKKDTQDHRVPVALVGKVYCKADAQYSSIEVGDLLTTSPTPGHAMKAADPARAFGAVIGKALRPLSSGVSLIPILVTLQ